MSLRPVTVLVSAAGAPGTAALLRGLRENGEREVRLVGTDMSERSVGRHLCDAFHLVPPGSDSGFADAVLDVVGREGVDVVLPQSSFDLEGLSVHRDRFDVPVLVSAPDTIHRSNDKAETYAFLHRIGVPAPQFRRVNGAAEVDAAARELGYPDRPVCFKPVFSSGSRGFRVLDPTVDRAHQLLYERPGSVAMRLEEAVELLPPEDGPDLLVMELATGGERTIDGIADGRRVVLGHPKTREAMRAGLAMYFVTLDDPGLMEIADRIVAELGIEWFFNIQLVGEHVIEVNPRISTIVYQEDFDLPYLGVKRARGRSRTTSWRRCARASARGAPRSATSTSSSGARDPGVSPRDTPPPHRPLPPSTPRASHGRTSRPCGDAASTHRSSSSTATPCTPRQTGRWSSTARSSVDRSRSGARLPSSSPRTDLFHFTFGLTLVPQSLQFPILRAFGKRSVMHYLGSDIRGKTPEELAYGKKAGAEIVGSYDAIRWVPEATVIPPGVDLRAIRPAPAAERRRPVVVHAPSSRRRKGTDHVLHACEALDVELRIVEGLHHNEALARYRDADIVVDQLHAGWYGLFAIECMALGKPVVTFLHEEAIERTEEAYGLPVPIVNATSESLYTRLEELVEMGPTGREEIGQASRAYVEQVHDLERVTDQLVELYETVLEPRRASRAAAVAPAGPPSDLPPVLPLGDTGLDAAAPGAEIPAAERLAGDASGLGSQLRRLGRHSVIYGIGGLVSRVIAVLLLPVYTRYLTPGDYGQIETLLALTTVMGLILRAGITSAFFRFYFDVDDDEERLRLLRTSFWFTMGAGTLGLVLLLAFAEPVSTVLFGDAGAADLVRAAGVSLWATVNYEQLTALFRVEERSVAYVSASLANVFITIGLTLLLVVSLDKGALGVIAGNFSGTLIVYLAPRLPARAARAPVRPRPPARDEPLRRASRPDSAVPLGDELQRPLLPRQARRRGRGWSLLGRSANRVGDSSS